MLRAHGRIHKRESAAGIAQLHERVDNRAQAGGVDIGHTSEVENDFRPIHCRKRGDASAQFLAGGKSKATLEVEDSNVVNSAFDERHVGAPEKAASWASRNTRSSARRR